MGSETQIPGFGIPVYIDRRVPPGQILVIEPTGQGERLIVSIEGWLHLSLPERWARFGVDLRRRTLARLKANEGG